MKRFEDVPPVDPEQFGFAVEVASAAHALKMPMKSPAAESVLLDWGNGRATRVRFTDVPMNRAAMAIRDHYAPDKEAAFAALARFVALTGIWRSKKMRKWVGKSKPNAERIEVHNAVFHAAAVLPLNAKGEFEEGAFFDKVAELAEAEEGGG